MAGLLRVAFVNTSKETSVTIHVETQDSVECCELLTTTPATGPEQNPGTRHKPGRWNVVVGPGKMHGFVTEHPVKITNPNSAAVHMVYADSKDPWPQPPPVAALAGVHDVEVRYRSFLMGGALPDPSPKPIVMILAPAHMTP
jgi:hypothetical protein